MLKEFNLRVKLIYTLFSEKVYDFDTVQRVINDYYRDPVSVLRKYRIIK